MPTYVYRFDDGVEVEHRQSIHEDAKTTLPHPETGEASAVRRVIAGSPVINLRSSAGYGRAGWARTANDWKRENFGTADDRELGRRGIVRADPN